MKKLASLALTLVLMLTACTAFAQITVTKKDLNVNRGLNSNVTNILVLMQDENVTDTMMLASIDSKTGRAVMTRLDTEMMVDVPQAGEAALKDVYMMGAEKSRGLLAVATVNKLLSLNINTYVALDMTMLPELVDIFGVINMQLTAEEAAVFGGQAGTNGLTGERLLEFVRLRLESDAPARSRGYDALMQLLYQGLHSGSVTDLMGLGTKLLKSMDTNLNVLNAVTLVSAVQAGSDRRELVLPAKEHIVSSEPLKADAEAMRTLLYANIYE